MRRRKLLSAKKKKLVTICNGKALPQNSTLTASCGSTDCSRDLPRSKFILVCQGKCMARACTLFYHELIMIKWEF
jgi:hypothetical protein